MSWDVPTKENCPECGKTLFKRSGRGRNKPYCINEDCKAFVPEDQRGYKKKITGEDPSNQGDKTEEKTEEKPAKKSAAGKPAKKKTGAKS